MQLHCYPSTVKHHAQARAGELLDQVDAELARHGDWLLGSRYSALEPYLFTPCRWTRGFPSGAARERPQLGLLLHRMLERPAMQRVLAAEGLQMPFV